MEIDGKRPTATRSTCRKPAASGSASMAAEQGLEIYAVAANNDFSSPIPEHREAQSAYIRELMRMTGRSRSEGHPGVSCLARRNAAAGGRRRYDIAEDVWKAEHKDFSAEETWGWCRKAHGSCRTRRRFRDHAGLAEPPAGDRQGLWWIACGWCKEVASPHLKICFDARLEHSLDEASVRKAVNEVGTTPGRCGTTAASTGPRTRMESR